MDDEKRRKAREASRKFEAAHREERNERMRQLRQKRRAELGPPKVRGPNKKPAKNALPPELAAEAARMPGEPEIEWRRRYNRVKTRHYRMKHPERDRENRLRQQRTPEYKEYRKKYHAANPHIREKIAKKYFETNKDARLAMLNKWRAENKDRVRQINKEWLKAHPGVAQAAAARARARAVHATPPWMWSLYGKEVERIYRRAVQLSKSTGIPHHVDHIYPLAGKTSCGLHVPWNLQILTEEENLKKRNKCPVETGYITE